MKDNTFILTIAIGALVILIIGIALSSCEIYAADYLGQLWSNQQDAVTEYIVESRWGLPNEVGQAVIDKGIDPKSYVYFKYNTASEKVLNCKSYDTKEQAIAGRNNAAKEASKSDKYKKLEKFEFTGGNYSKQRNNWRTGKKMKEVKKQVVPRR